MNLKFTILSLLTIATLLIGCATTQSEITNNNFNSTLWVQKAAEYEANSIQAYNSAESNIDVALRDKSSTAALKQGSNYSMLPPALILDIDETVLDNSQYQAQLVLNGEEFNPESWDK